LLYDDLNKADLFMTMFHLTFEPSGIPSFFKRMRMSDLKKDVD
jgi:hypothetical protein